MKRILSVLALALLAAVAHAQTAAPALVDAEVTKVDKTAGKVTLKHGEIKNLDMPAMTMSFRVSEAKWLDELTAGQKVKFTAEKLNGQYTVVQLQK